MPRADALSALSGLGNLKQNALPKCQLLRLQRLVNMLYGNPIRPIPFWIDTICVPLTYPHRGVAINSMRRTYKEAEKVLVLDSAISGRASTSLSAMEIVVRLRTSSWVRRLWTFHEAYLAKELHYQLKDITMSLSDIRNRFHHEKNTREHSDSIRNRLEAAHIIWYDAYSFLSKNEVLGKFEPQEDHKRLISIMHPLRWRTTSRMKDETICLSGCLDRTVEDLDAAETAAERMKLFLLSMKTVPAGLMFTDRPRIQEIGCHWMPLSLLSGGMGSTLPDTWAGGYSIGYPTPSGLLVTLPGIFLEDIHKYDQTFRGGHQHEVIFMEIEKVPFYVYGLLTEPIIWDSYAGMDIALILSGKLDERGTFGAIVQVCEPSEAIIRCNFLICAMIMGNPQVHRNLEDTIFTTASHSEGSLQWRVG